MSNETSTTIDEIMLAVFVSQGATAAYDASYGPGTDDLEREMFAADDAVRDLIAAALDSQARQIEALTAERDELRKRLDDAKPATPAPGEWIEWSGGDVAPVADGVSFEFKFRDGIPPVCGPYRDATKWRWNHHGISGDIVAYRILP